MQADTVVIFCYVVLQQAMKIYHAYPTTYAMKMPEVGLHDEKEQLFYHVVPTRLKDEHISRMLEMGILFYSRGVVSIVVFLLAMA